jgi:hypothetical protein
MVKIKYSARFNTASRKSKIVAYLLTVIVFHTGGKELNCFHIVMKIVL